MPPSCFQDIALCSLGARSLVEIVFHVCRAVQKSRKLEDVSRDLTSIWAGIRIGKSAFSLNSGALSDSKDLEKVKGVAMCSKSGVSASILTKS